MPSEPCIVLPCYPLLAMRLMSDASFRKPSRRPSGHGAWRTSFQFMFPSMSRNSFARQRLFGHGSWKVRNGLSKVLKPVSQTHCSLSPGLRHVCHICFIIITSWLKIIPVTATSVDLTIFEGVCGGFMCPMHLSMFHFTGAHSDAVSGQQLQSNPMISQGQRTFQANARSPKFTAVHEKSGVELHCKYFIGGPILFDAAVRARVI